MATLNDLLVRPDERASNDREVIIFNIYCCYLETVLPWTCTHSSEFAIDFEYRAASTLLAIQLFVLCFVRSVTISLISSQLPVRSDWAYPFLGWFWDTNCRLVDHLLIFGHAIFRVPFRTCDIFPFEKTPNLQKYFVVSSFYAEFLVDIFRLHRWVSHDYLCAKSVHFSFFRCSESITTPMTEGILQMHLFSFCWSGDIDAFKLMLELHVT